MAFDGVTVAALVKEFNTTLKDGRTSLSIECFLVLTQAFL